ncbi:hypothetical protein DAPPUDRAFT_325158 [Daphnia pulex]|uniref:Uncharacterized protein n=1 Tax=Daphnia pulex TaxID=6669 RepID=E9H3W1_DAPPU|nr:hypothetical protein DAPPUDRAFT_325158 [Daphnia pulex]|eukprot:EFX73596.1 hypothetical protein DAPPUDRAFT_325158 [Daphnia pulex]
MRFQVQILLAVAVCVVALLHGACSAPTASDALLVDSERSVDDNGENDENPLLILAAKLFVKQVGCPVAKAKAASCGFRELLSEIPSVPLAPLDRSPGDDDVDEAV